MTLITKFINALNYRGIRYEKLNRALENRQYFQCFLFSLSVFTHKSSKLYKETLGFKFFSDDTCYIVFNDYEIDAVVRILAERLKKSEELFELLEDKIYDIGIYAEQYNIKFYCELFKNTLNNPINANVADSIMQLEIAGMNFDYTYEKSNYIYLIIEEIANCKTPREFFSRLHHHLRLITPKNLEGEMINLCADIQNVIKRTDFKNAIDKDITATVKSTKKNKI